MNHPFTYPRIHVEARYLYTKSIIINNFNIQIKGNVVNFWQ